MKKFIKNLIQYALPISATNLISMASAFFTTMMLAELGHTELAALAIANTCYITLSAFLNTCLYSTSILIGQHLSAGNKEEVASLIWNSLWLSMFLSLIGAALLWPMDRFLLLIGQSPKLVSYTVDYFHYGALTMIPSLIGSALGQVYNGLGRPLVSSVIVLIRLPLTVYFCYELILGHYHLGLAGATLGLLIAVTLVLFVGLIYVRLSDVWLYLQMKHIKRYHWQKIKELFDVGIHIGLQFLGELGALSIATFFMGYLGSIALASSQIVSQYSILLIMIIIGISQALSIRISEVCGRQEYDLIESYTRAALILTTSIVLFFGIIYLCMPLQMMRVFIDIHDPFNNQLIELTHWLMFLAIPILLIDSVKNIYTSSLRGMKNSKTPMLIGNASLWFVGLPACYFIGIFAHQGPIGLRIGFSFGYIVATVALWIYFGRYKIQFIHDALQIK